MLTQVTSRSVDREGDLTIIFCIESKMLLLKCRCKSNLYGVTYTRNSLEMMLCNSRSVNVPLGYGCTYVYNPCCCMRVLGKVVSK